MNFDFYNPTRLLTGMGCIEKYGASVAALGKKCMIVTGGSSAVKSGALDRVTQMLDSCSVSYILFDRVRQNPLLSAAKEAADIARSEGVDFIIGIGGGSPLDSAKAAAVFTANDIPMMDIYNLDWPNPAIPVIAVGTTAGTGSEVNSFAVLTTPDGIKKSISSSQLYPVIAFGDPSFTATLPLSFTISTALDAMSHAIEGYFSTSANEISDMYAIQSIKILYMELNKIKGIMDVSLITPEVRENLYYASILAGYTLSRCGTCYCHALGYFLSEKHFVAHGTACAVFLPGFLIRAKGLVPVKADALASGVGRSIEGISSFVEQLHRCPTIRLNPDEIREIVTRNLPTGNFTRTAPSGFTEKEAIEEMTRLFGQ